MSELRDTPIKLFGWTITSSLAPVLPDSFDHGMENSSSSSSSSSPSLRLHMMNNQSATDNKKQDNTSLQISSDLNKLESKETSENSDDQHSDITSEITTTTTSEEKTTDLKKPDKILPCPRCTSRDTKFCYYNNYNVNQPRHFCRNCQRYWTSGGSMRTVPVGSGRRKNKGWVSTDHYMHINSENSSSDYTNNYNSSSTKILNFESSDSFVTENGKHQSSDVKITANSVSQDFNKFQAFLPPQVTSPVSPPWPYQYPLNPSFSHIPVYWGCTVPFLVYSKDFHMSRKKRTRDEVSHETVRESKDTFVRARLDSSSESINNEASVATENHVWYPVPMEREKTEQFSFFINGSASKSSNNRFVPETYLNLKANPAAMARSMTFRESM